MTTTDICYFYDKSIQNLSKDNNFITIENKPDFELYFEYFHNLFLTAFIFIEYH